MYYLKNILALGKSDLCFCYPQWIILKYLKYVRFVIIFLGPTIIPFVYGVDKNFFFIIIFM
jgi:hypothetical protein